VTLQADYIAAKEEIATKRLALKTLFETANKETDPVKRDEVAASIKTANTELAELVDKIEPLQELVEAEKANTAALKSMRQSGARQIQPEEEEVSRETGSSDEVLSSGIKSIHELLMQGMDAKGIKSYHGFRGEIGELAVKTLLTSADASPVKQRLPSIQLSAQEERTVADLMLSGTTQAQKISYYEETTFTNAAVETAEGDLKGESALAFTLREDNVRKIATRIPVTDEMLEDLPGFES
jgi:hypothetical protein